MKDKTTDDLRQALMAESNIDSYLRENQPFFAGQSIAELLAVYYERTDLSKAALARKAGMSEVYLHQVFAGRRNPSRARLLCRAWGWRPPWRRPSSSSSWPATRRSTPDSSGTPSSATASCTTWPWGRSTTSCSRRMKRPYFDGGPSKKKEKERIP